MLDNPQHPVVFDSVEDLLDVQILHPAHLSDRFC